MSKNMNRLVRFAVKYPESWHSYGKDRSTVRALAAAEANGFIEIERTTRQFRLAIPEHYRFKMVEWSRLNEVATKAGYADISAAMKGDK